MMSGKRYSLRGDLQSGGLRNFSMITWVKFGPKVGDRWMMLDDCWSAPKKIQKNLEGKKIGSTGPKEPKSWPQSLRPHIRRDRWRRRESGSGATSKVELKTKQKRQALSPEISLQEFWVCLKYRVSLKWPLKNCGNDHDEIWGCPILRPDSHPHG